MAESTFFGAIVGFMAGVSLGLFLCQGNACVTWFRDLSPVVVLGLGVIGLLLGSISGAIWGSWVSREGS